MGTDMAITLLLGLLDRAAAWGAVISKARDEGRELTEAEVDAFASADDAAKEALEEAIRKARG
jgi:hypothetical protein